MRTTKPYWRITKIKQGGGATGGDSDHRAAAGPDPVRPLERARASERASGARRRWRRRRRRRRGDGVGAHMLKKFVRRSRIAMATAADALSVALRDVAVASVAVNLIPPNSECPPPSESLPPSRRAARRLPSPFHRVDPVDPVSLPPSCLSMICISLS